MGSEPTADALRPIPSFVFPEAAAAALARAARYGEWRTRPEGHVPAFSDLDAEAARSAVRSALEPAAGGHGPAERAGAACRSGHRVRTEHGSGGRASRRPGGGGDGYPVALKAFGPSIVHKTELGAIRLNLPDAAADESRLPRAESFTRRRDDRRAGAGNGLRWSGNAGRRRRRPGVRSGGGVCARRHDARTVRRQHVRPDTPHRSSTRNR